MANSNPAAVRRLADRHTIRDNLVRFYRELAADSQ